MTKKSFMGNYRKIRFITILGLGGLFMIALQGLSLAVDSTLPTKQIQIFVDGKKYNSIDEYRRYQVERTKKSSILDSHANAPSLKVAQIKAIVSILLQAQAHLQPTLFSQEDLKHMLKRHDLLPQNTFEHKISQASLESLSDKIKH